MAVSMDKQYRTCDGREVRIYAVDGEEDYPVHGAIKFDYGWEIHSWDDNGASHVHPNYNLVEAKPRIQREYWVNVYQKNYINPVLWETLDEAKQSIPYGFEPIARVKVVIDCEEGEGL